MLVRFLCLLSLFLFPLTATTLPYSTFLRAGFQPAAVATDAAGNIYLAGSAVVNPETSQTAAMVVKLNAKGSAYVYERTIGGSGSDLASAIAVDSAGNAYVTGTAASPDFPVTVGAQLGTPPSGPSDTRTFLLKLDPQGSVMVSEFLGGSVTSFGQAVALTPGGNILVSGTANSGFPVTPGAFNASGTAPRPYLMSLDPSGATVKFSNFGIGGSALVTDAAGDIYMSGATTLLDYPTTSGAYQAFKAVFGCFGLCMFQPPGTNQYLTKVDPTGIKLVYSTAVGGGGQTSNAGLAVDSSGNAYLTGLTYGTYPYTVKDPGTPQNRPFLTKIDPAGQNMLFSVPIGGAGVGFDASGNLYVGGSYNNSNNFAGLPNPLPLPGLPPGALTPQACQLNAVTTVSQAYVSQVDAATGNIGATQLVDSSNLSATGIAVAGPLTVWLTGTTTMPDVPITSGAVTLPANAPAAAGPLSGAYLGTVNFSTPPIAITPQVSCVLDAANGSRLGPVSLNQILSIFGTNLGPAQGVAASDTSTTSLGGVTVTFNGIPGTLLYVSSSQINVAVPFNPPLNGNFSMAMQVNAGGPPSTPRQLPIAAAVPGIFATLSTTIAGCGAPTPISPAVFVPLVLQNGAQNSCANPAKAGSVVSIFLNGLNGETLGRNDPVVPVVNGWPAEVVNVAADTGWVSRVDFKIPAEAAVGGGEVSLQVFVGQTLQPVTPLQPFNAGNRAAATYPMFLWVSQ